MDSFELEYNTQSGGDAELEVVISFSVADSVDHAQGIAQDEWFDLAESGPLVITTTPLSDLDRALETGNADVPNFLFKFVIDKTWGLL